MNRKSWPGEVGSKAPNVLGHGIFSLTQTAVVSAVKLEALQGVELFFDFAA